MVEVAKKHGLLYSSDFKNILGIDEDSTEFSGVVPTGATRVEEDAFSCCSLKNISLPESITEIGANVFCNSTNLETVKLPTGLKELSDFMFCGCSSLKSIEMPYEINDFTVGLFAGCASLKEIPFRAGIKTLPESVFEGCDSIKSLVIPRNVKKICSNAIKKCKNLTTIVFPENLEIFEENAISECPKLSRIRISEENKKFRSDENFEQLFEILEDGSEKLIFEVPNKIKSEIPEYKELDETENHSIFAFDDDEEDEDFSVIANDEQTDIQSEQIATQCEQTDLQSETVATQCEQADIQNKSIDVQSQQYDIQSVKSDLQSEAIATQSEQNEQSDILNDNPAEQNAIEEVNPLINENIIQEEQKMENEEIQPENSVDSKLAEIMGQEKQSDESNLSIMDIPEESEEDVPGAIPEIPKVIQDKINETEEDEEKSVFNNLIFEAKKVEQQKIEVADASEEKNLFVFAENLVDGQFGKAFSESVKSCANRLAKIHKYTSIFYFHGIDLQNEKFRQQFINYMKEKNTLLVCNTTSISVLNENTKDFAECIGISLNKEEIKNQMKNATNSDCKLLKLITCDN